MKCICGDCGGTGEVTCGECNGRGTYEGRIEEMKLDEGEKHYAALNEVQKDARRAIYQAGQLKALNPARSESYDKQLRATLFVLNGEAERITEEEESSICVSK